MFVVSESEAAAIRTVFEQEGEFSAAIELRRRFPGIADNEQAREQVRTDCRLDAAARDPAFGDAIASHPDPLAAARFDGSAPGSATAPPWPPRPSLRRPGRVHRIWIEPSSIGWISEIVDPIEQIGVTTRFVRNRTVRATHQRTGDERQSFHEAVAFGRDFATGF